PMKRKLECKGVRRRWQSRTIIGSLALATASLSACGDNQGDENAELQAILRDGDLTEVMTSMLTAAGGSTGSGGGSTPDMTGAGGRTAPPPGSAGGPPGMGAGGSFGV